MVLIAVLTSVCTKRLVLRQEDTEIVKNVVIIQNGKDGITPCQSNSEFPAPILLYTDIAVLLDFMFFFLS